MPRLPRFRFQEPARQESKIFVDCPYKDCHFVTKCGDKFLKHFKECTRKYSEDGSTRLQELHFTLLSRAKRCLYKGCYFKSTDPMELCNHMKECPPTDYDVDLMAEFIKIRKVKEKHLEVKTIGKTDF